MQKVMIFVLFLNFASFWAFIQHFAYVGPRTKNATVWQGGVLHKKKPLQKVDAGQSGSQNWKKTSENLGKKYKGTALEGTQVEF